MTQRGTISVLVSCAAVLGGLYLASFLGRNSRAPEAVSSALLNPARVGSVAEIRISDAGGGITLRLEGGIWTGRQDGVVFPVAADTVEAFLGKASRIRTLYAVSSGEASAPGRFGLDGESALEVSFVARDGAVVSRLFFGSSNYSGHRIHVRTDDSPVYETDDDLFPWLETSARRWADMSIVPLAAAGAVAGDVQRILAQRGETGRVLYPDDAGFQEAASALLSLRGGRILPAGEVTTATDGNGAGPLLFLRLDMGNGGTVSIRVFAAQASSGEEEEYLVLPEVQPGAGGAAASVCRGFSYALGISGWTYGRLSDAIGHW